MRRRILSFSAFLLLALYVAIVPVIAFAGSDNSDKGCGIMHKGRFTYLSGDDPTAYILISGSSHTEYYNNGKYFIKSKLTWVNECEFDMEMTEITLPEFPFKPGDTMHVSIDNVAGDVISYTGIVKGMTMNGQLKKVK